MLWIWGAVVDSTWPMIENLFKDVSFGVIEHPAAFWPLVAATAIATVGLAVTVTRLTREIILLCHILPTEVAVAKMKG